MNNKVRDNKDVPFELEAHTAELRDKQGQSALGPEIEPPLDQDLSTGRRPSSNYSRRRNYNNEGRRYQEGQAYREGRSGQRGTEPIQFDILAHVGELGSSRSGWIRELNVVSWNKRQARLDIRDWDPSHLRMSRGISLNANEAERLVSLLQGFDYGRLGL